MDHGTTSISEKYITFIRGERGVHYIICEENKFWKQSKNKKLQSEWINGKNYEFSSKFLKSSQISKIIRKFQNFLPKFLQKGSHPI